MVEFIGRLLHHAIRRDVIHLHTNGHNLKSWLLIFACACAGLLGGRRTIVSIGSGAAPDFVGAARGPARLLVRAGLGLTGAVICRNVRMRQVLDDAGIDAGKIAILPGFYGVRTGGLPDIPAEIAAFLEQHSPVLAGLAESGLEYGVPLLLQAARDLQKRYPRLGVFLMGPERVEMSAGVFWTGELAHDMVLSVMRKASVFVRPTYFDGDASSVREALALGVPVVASDTDYRPEGVLLFRRGDAGDLANALVRALEQSGPPAAAGGGGDAFGRLLTLYEGLTASRPVAQASVGA